MEHFTLIFSQINQYNKLFRKILEILITCITNLVQIYACTGTENIFFS